jgi:hypothetical protein
MGGDDVERKMLAELLLVGGSVEDEMNGLALAICIHRYSVLR